MKLITLQTGPIDTNTYLFETASGVAVVDPGGDADKIVAAATREFNKPVKFVLLTHTHYDHTGGVEDLQRQGAFVYMHNLELELTKSIFGLFGKVKPDGFVCASKHLDLDGVPVEVLHTPGHSAGSVCYIVGDNLFSGDTLFKEEVGRCDLPSGDFPTMKKSLKQIFNLKHSYKILPGHGETSTLDFERKNNRYAII